jgi:hypothetical protein
MKISDLIGKAIVTVDEKTLGHIFEIVSENRPKEAESMKSVPVSGLVYGRRGLLQRFGLREPQVQTLPWDEVVEIREHQVIVRKK